MPWTSDEALSHTKQATTPELRRLWAHVANEALKKYGDEGKAIRIANAVVHNEKRWT